LKHKEAKLDLDLSVVMTPLLEINQQRRGVMQVKLGEWGS